MTADIHTCSYYCERPGCIRAQRDELRDRLEAVLAQQSAAVDEAMARMANKARQLQRKFYGDACGLHLEMIDWAREFDALAAQQRGGAE